MSENTKKYALNVLFLSADTGGGHRASAESLARQFQLQFPGSQYTLLNVLADANIYANMEKQYKDLSANPAQWKVLYYITNTKAMDFVTTVQMKISEEPKIREKIKSNNPDVVVSVHPLMNNVPLISCRKISRETGKPLPFFTVVTDLGSGHAQWFANQVEKIFVASEQIKTLAKVRGRIPDEKFVDSGLPIRHDFAVEASNLGDRHSVAGKSYQKKVQKKLNIPYPERRSILVMGGGEGVGSLSDIVDALYAQFVAMDIDANILVVCGRNAVLKDDLENRNWTSVVHNYYDKKIREQRNTLSLVPVCFEKSNGMNSIPNPGCFDGGVTMNIRRILSNTSMTKDSAVSPTNFSDDKDNFVEDDNELDDNNQFQSKETGNSTPPANEYDIYNSALDSYEDNKIGSGKVNVIGLGFVTNMAEYMVVADVLVTKAGPGTIAEAASLSLPVMLTNFLPGQEEGNVEFVVKGGFGSYRSDNTPSLAAEVVASWLLDDEKLKELSSNSKQHGKPEAAAEIVRIIGNTTLKLHNDEKSGNSG